MADIGSGDQVVDAQETQEFGPAQTREHPTEAMFGPRIDGPIAKEIREVARLDEWIPLDSVSQTISQDVAREVLRVALRRDG